jgi:heparosan-N-sulfate-glucuronate 5-epimerase
VVGSGLSRGLCTKSLVACGHASAAAEPRAALQSRPDFSNRLAPIYGSNRYAGCSPLNTSAGTPKGADLDENGVRIVDYGEPIGRQYNPVTIEQTALGCYHSYLRSGNPTERKIYLDQVEWLRHNYLTVGPGLAAYVYHFPWSFGLKAGWRSGLAQGQGISALVRYYYDTGDATVLNLIRSLERYMLLPEAKGGVVAATADGGMWIEEYPSHPPSLVLNGFISAVFGLYEYTKLFPHDASARGQLAKAIRSIRASLHLYDSGNWTYLDRWTIPHSPSNDAYALGYVYQLEALWDLTQDSLFLKTSLRWDFFYQGLRFNSAGNMVADGTGYYRLLPELPVAMPINSLPQNYSVVSSTPMMPGSESTSSLIMTTQHTWPQHKRGRRKST